VKFLELTLAFVISVSVVASTEMLVNIPNFDVPDIKDIAFLFPNLN
jgi:hypothetical protein